MTKGSHTWQEILSQPQIWRVTLEAFATDQIALHDFLDQVDLDQFIVVGCGSTGYLAQTAAAILTHCTGIPARAFPASELWLFPGMISPRRTLLLAISRSGATTETLRALARFRETHGGPVLAITCYPESPLARQADFALVTPGGQEQSVAQTRSFTSMLLLTQALAATLAHDEKMLEHLQQLPNALEDLVARLGDLPQRLGTDLGIERIFFLGGGPLYGLANEAMLKTKEMSLSYAEAYHPLEFRHGPMSMVNEHTLVVGLLSDAGLEEELRVLRDMYRLGANTLALVEDAAALTAWRPDYLVELRSSLDEWERGPLYLPVLQRLAYHRAMTKGLDPDRPHNLTAVVEL
ncbi:MAG: SIS domain-containing protein [Anaerolineae bacterium]|jgi:glucosamine--fructose-6-phosphate aminotransferase (isomerizing)|nr:SIS domain-containing protein [Anaerolineae bacterium]